MLRKVGVVGKFVEFYGSGVAKMRLADRATIANMAPEYGATMGFLPRRRRNAQLFAQYRPFGRRSRARRTLHQGAGYFRTDDAPAPRFTQNVSLDISTIEPSLAGPKRPQDRVALSQMKSSFNTSLTAPISERGFALENAALSRTATVQNGQPTEIGHGAVVIAAITSCTNTSNPSVMLAAGLVAQRQSLVD